MNSGACELIHSPADVLSKTLIVGRPISRKILSHFFCMSWMSCGSLPWLQYWKGVNLTTISWFGWGLALVSPQKEEIHSAFRLFVAAKFRPSRKRDLPGFLCLLFKERASSACSVFPSASSPRIFWTTIWLALIWFLALFESCFQVNLLPFFFFSSFSWLVSWMAPSCHHLVWIFVLDAW